MLKVRTFKKIFIKFCFFWLFCMSANAAINFSINDREIPKNKILINVSTSKSGQEQVEKKSIKEILDRTDKNLTGTDLFSIYYQKSRSENIESSGKQSIESLSVETIPDFSQYQENKIDMLLVIDARFNQFLELEIKIRLWDILDERQLFGKFYSANKESYKKVASLISDEIFKAATGEKIGNFDSKIVYVAESGKAKNRIKRIAMMDFDGENHRYLTNGRNLVLTPVFSKENNEILFVRFFGDKPQIYSLDINNALVRKVGGFRGMTFAPTINPKNPEIIAFSAIENGNSNIYQMDLFSNQTTRLTYGRTIDTTPSYSPDGRKIVFSSDRTGNQQLYVMDVSGGQARKLSYNKGSYSKPMWSPDGNFIAFTKLRSNKFSIGVIDVNGRNEKILTEGYLVEGAKWSPSGRYIIYSKKDGAYGKKSVPQLWMIDVLTGFERQIPTPKNEGATDPDWVIN
ncbi:MAG: TolB protein [Rickettsiales bacterium]|jgi:TolB protein